MLILALAGSLPMTLGSGLSKGGSENQRALSARSSGRGFAQTSLPHPFADLVIIAGWLHPIPFRTRP